MTRPPLFAACLLVLVGAGGARGAGFDGRWVIEHEADPLGRAGWLEIEGSETGAIRGGAVGLQPGGQLDPIAAARVEDGFLHFEVERPVGRDANRRIVRSSTSARLVGETLHGVTIIDNKARRWVGRRAPEIADRDDGSWRRAEPVALFDPAGGAGDLARWRGRTTDPVADWSVRDGLLVNSDGADLLVSRDEFWNFELHAEFLVKPGMNSGIALRARYEIQILDDYGEPPSKGGNGALYSRVPPAKNASLPAGEWQTLHVRLVGRDLTVTLNGERIHDKVVVEGLTAMATDGREDQPGPLTLQGDHGEIAFRKIVLTPLVR